MDTRSAGLYPRYSLVEGYFEQSKNADILGMREMQCTEEAWADWLSCDNEYARCDASAVKAGALEYLNTIMVVLRKRQR